MTCIIRIRDHSEILSCQLQSIDAVGSCLWSWGPPLDILRIKSWPAQPELQARVVLIISYSYRQHLSFFCQLRWVNTRNKPSNIIKQSPTTHCNSPASSVDRPKSPSLAWPPSALERKMFGLSQGASRSIKIKARWVAI